MREQRILKGVWFILMLIGVWALLTQMTLISPSGGHPKPNCYMVWDATGTPMIQRMRRPPRWATRVQVLEDHKCW